MYTIPPNIHDMHNLNMNSNLECPKTEVCPSGEDVNEPLIITNRQKKIDNAEINVCNSYSGGEEDVLL